LGDPIEEELRAMLQEPTIEKLLSDQIKSNALMRDVGRTFARLINERLANVEKHLTKAKEAS
jgi:signal transduction histidine kinase